MQGRKPRDFVDAYRTPFAVVLGTGEIPSAVAVYLKRAGFSTISEPRSLPARHSQVDGFP